MHVKGAHLSSTCELLMKLLIASKDYKIQPNVGGIKWNGNGNESKNHVHVWSASLIN